eukprot:6883993-Prymnesium_polylepis.1
MRHRGKLFESITRCTGRPPEPIGRRLRPELSDRLKYIMHILGPRKPNYCRTAAWVKTPVNGSSCDPVR